jgi:hypothetical protein
MKLESMVRGKGKRTKWTATLEDVRGEASYELAIRGPGRLVERMFAKSDITHEIDPGMSLEAAQERLRAIPGEVARDAKTRFGDAGEDPFKKEPKKLDPAQTVIVSARRTRGSGTFWFFTFPFLAIPVGVSLLFALPPVMACNGTTVPIAGDSDLYLTLGGPGPPVVAKSIFGGTAVDSVSFSAPFYFVPFFRVVGYTTTLTNFSMSGFSFGF